MPLVRPRTVADAATPAGNGIMAEVLARLFHITGDPDWRSRATCVLAAFTGDSDQLAGMPTLLAAADLLEEGASVVVTGPTDTATSLVRAALRAPDPAVVVLRVGDLQIGDAGVLSPDHPAFGKSAGSHEAAAYVCRRNVCGLPIINSGTLSVALSRRI